MTGNTLVIGIGNEYRHDDTVGLIVARRLREKNLDGVKVLELSGEGAALIEAWRDAETVILVDAVHSGAAPGTIFRFAARQQSIPTTFFHYSTHAFSVAEAIELARTLNQLPSRLIVYGIEGKDFAAGEGTSPEVEQAASRVVDSITEELR
jgi:hydrogenase maturation protease